MIYRYLEVKDTDTKNQGPGKKCGGFRSTCEFQISRGYRAPTRKIKVLEKNAADSAPREGSRDPEVTKRRHEKSRSWKKMRRIQEHV